MKSVSAFLVALLFLCPLMAHSEVTTEVFCFRSLDGKNINFEFRTYYDSAANWSGAGVRYGKSKKSIGLVQRSTEYEELAEGRPYQYTIVWAEVADGTMTGEYEMVSQGGRIDVMNYTNYKSGKKYLFKHDLSMEPTLEKGCQW